MTTGPQTDRAVAEAVISANLRKQLRFWLLTAAFLIAFLYLFSEILLPFAAGMVLAYFLDPVADRLERLGLSRVVAALVILAVFVAVVAITLILLVPILASQFSDLVENLPNYIGRVATLIRDVNPEWLQRFGISTDNLGESLSSGLNSGLGFVSAIFSSLWRSGVALIGFAGLFVVTPVVAFYMLIDWDRMVAAVDACVPRDHVETVRGLAHEIDRATAGFVRGQGLLCLFLGTYYAVGLTLSGLNFGILIGLFSGLISFIPYVGSMTGLLLSLGVALVQFWPDYPRVLIVVGVFLTGQFIEGNILQPKLVGKSVGLHPVWVMFALLAFGVLFGFMGLLIAVPAAAAVGVLVRFALRRYLESPLYKGGNASAEIEDVVAVDLKTVRRRTLEHPNL